MKILAMADVIRLKQVEHVKNEKSILQEIDHPFVVNMWVEESDQDNNLMGFFVVERRLVVSLSLGDCKFY